MTSDKPQQLLALAVDLAIIDGVESVAGGEGLWIPELRPIQPRLLFAGRNAICTDSVCAAAMGYDARAAAGQFPLSRRKLPALGL